ncbi:MAG: hypothetical protein J2P50_19895, partial [Hyphomicrobiaceae bacterium]|nr:hypothetical protein [Hyphomicrobiaceae bacterium]
IGAPGRAPPSATCAEAEAALTQYRPAHRAPPNPGPPATPAIEKAGLAQPRPRPRAILVVPSRLPAHPPNALLIEFRAQASGAAGRGRDPERAPRA